MKAIGGVAHRTIYSSNPVIRHRWRGATRYLMRVRADAARKLAALRSPPVRQPSLGFPPHHALWMCIHSGEGAWADPNSGNNGHYGGLQMTPGWMGMFSGTANQYSQLQQEWFAENAYRAQGYSRVWLNGQWGETIGPCWQYA